MCEVERPSLVLAFVEWMNVYNAQEIGKNGIVVPFAHEPKGYYFFSRPPLKHTDRVLSIYRRAAIGVDFPPLLFCTTPT